MTGLANTAADLPYLFEWLVKDLLPGWRRSRMVEDPARQRSSMSTKIPLQAAQRRVGTRMAERSGQRRWDGTPGF